ncbi:hypothetical protein OJF2_24340 [Aquisphaera giovannonii]|uniref:Uncharacterized protein n=1 Tax=Aquisphaera giovannonii TaxID=406548 RepID=A0A5B9VZV2_9BACT|nr:DUF2934 domain-containing protein [Aquisphaera giovannonii]QEH33902.1 hypothetical protein OJF2_24340 [Aquisphaera giovannonii]
MEPSDQQIEKRAYERWERRRWQHGNDREDWIAARMDLVFDLNYATIAEIERGESRPKPVGAERRPRCRFCEQSAPRAAFSFVRPILPDFLDSPSPTTREICDACFEQLAGSLDRELAAFWGTLEGLRGDGAARRDLRIPTAIPIPAYKALARIALAMMPDADLADFNDTIEWVANPDHDFDGGLFGGVSCLLYQTRHGGDGAWAMLARRTDDEAPYPYMLFFLGSGRTILQVHLPLCTRDEDQEGEGLKMPQRSFTTGGEGDVHAATCLVLPLAPSDEPVRARRFRLF